MVVAAVLALMVVVAVLVELSNIKSQLPLDRIPSPLGPVVPVGCLIRLATIQVPACRRQFWRLSVSVADLALTMMGRTAALAVRGAAAVWALAQVVRDFAPRATMAETVVLAAISPAAVEVATIQAAVQEQMEQAALVVAETVDRQQAAQQTLVAAEVRVT